MVKDHTGRHPRTKHMKIIKKLRRRRRKLMTQQKRREIQALIQFRSPEKISKSIFKVTPETIADGPKSDYHLNFESMPELYNLCSEVDCTFLIV